MTQSTTTSDPHTEAESDAPRDSDAYQGLAFSRSELAAAMREAYDELIAFVTQPSFRAVYKELRSLPPAKRPEFVSRVFLRNDELERRGVSVPEGVLVQTSAFGDRRPTLFAVKKFLPEKFHQAWENANLTFDNEHAFEDVPTDPALAWRKPLPVAVQNALIVSNIDTQSVPDISLDDPGWTSHLGKSAAS